MLLNLVINQFTSLWTKELQFGNALTHLAVNQEAAEAVFLPSIWIGGHPNPGDAHPDSAPTVVSEG